MKIFHDKKVLKQYLDRKGYTEYSEVIKGKYRDKIYVEKPHMSIFDDRYLIVKHDENNYRLVKSFLIPN